MKRERKISVNWVSIDDNSFREAASISGFNPGLFDSLSEIPGLRSSVRSRLERDVKEAVCARFIREIDREWKELHSGAGLFSYGTGVYVISLGGGFFVDYGHEYSSVIYIGKGGLWNRLRNHSRDKLFDFWRTLAGVPFCFSLVSFTGDQTWKDYNDDICTSLEAHLLSYFSERMNDEAVTPLLNKNKGISSPAFSVDDFKRRPMWNTPLHLRGRPTWVLKPYHHADWQGALD